jgi:hypothetical protein
MVIGDFSLQEIKSLTKWEIRLKLKKRTHKNDDTPILQAVTCI